MAVLTTDLIPYASIGLADDPPGPTTDTETPVGGSIDPLYRVIFENDVPTGPGAELEIVQLGAGGDTTNLVTVRARQPDGTIVVSTPPTEIAGTSERDVLFPGTDFVNAILSVTVDLTGGDHGETIRLQTRGGGTVLVDIPGTVDGFNGVAERGAIRLFRESSIPVSDPADVRYEKIFFKNHHDSLGLSQAQVQFVLTHATLALALDDRADHNISVSNRETAPLSADLGASVWTPNDSTDPRVLSTEIDPGEKGADGVLGPGEAIGVWIRQTLPSATNAIETNFTIRLSGQTPL